MPSIRRTIDAMLAAALLVLLLPILLAVALWVALDRSGPVLHTETRVGRGGRLIRVHKFRTLRAGSPVEPAVAVPGDPRITRPGRWLRRWRVDELPQLACVVAGSMSLVGPRPQTDGNLAALDASTRQRLLSVRPGLTSATALAFLGEDDVLAETADPVHCYRTILVPAKARLEIEDLARRSLWRDAVVLLQTLRYACSRRARDRSQAQVRSLLASHGAVP